MKTLKNNVTLCMAAIALLSAAAMGRDNSAHNHSVKKTMDGGVAYLRKNIKDGKWMSPGITALCVSGILSSPRNYNIKTDKAWLLPPVQFLASLTKDDGAIYGRRVKNYTTAVAALALHEADSVAYGPIVKKAQAYLVKVQNKDGGFNYGGDGASDMSNLHSALDALRNTGADIDPEVYKRAVAFVDRCQNRSESNKEAWAGNDGGYVYAPSVERASAGTVKRADGSTGIKSYGAMSFAGVRSLLLSNISKDDVRVKDALAWIEKNYSLDEHVGLGTVSLYFYYATMAKSLDALGIETITTPDGKKHDWRVELVAKLKSVHQEDGSWVNSNPKYYEGVKPLCTAYALIALGHCKVK